MNKKQKKPCVFRDTRFLLFYGVGDVALDVPLAVRDASHPIPLNTNSKKLGRTLRKEMFSQERCLMPSALNLRLTYLCC